MVDQAKTLMCDSWWCVTKAPLLYVVEYWRDEGIWYPRHVCKACFQNVNGLSKAVIKAFDTQEERDLWLVKQRL